MSDVRCTYCGKAHPTGLCPHSWGGSVARASLRCSYCGSNQHTATYCPKTHGGQGARRRNPNGDFLDR